MNKIPLGRHLGTQRSECPTVFDAGATILLAGDPDGGISLDQSRGRSLAYFRIKL
jgi:hypothetical protein